MTEALENALNALSVGQRRAIVRYAGESRSPVSGPLWRAIRAEIFTLEMREAEVLASMQADHMAAMDELGPPLPPALGDTLTVDDVAEQEQ